MRDVYSDVSSVEGEVFRSPSTTPLRSDIARRFVYLVVRLSGVMVEAGLYFRAFVFRLV
jgi:hypothetical protein